MKKATITFEEVPSVGVVQIKTNNQGFSDHELLGLIEMAKQDTVEYTKSKANRNVGKFLEYQNNSQRIDEEIADDLLTTRQEKRELEKRIKVLMETIDKLTNVDNKPQAEVKGNKKPIED